MKQIYVGNLPQGFTTRQLYDLFVKFGRVESVLMAEDPKTGEVKDFGFIEMGDKEAIEAVRSLNNSNVGGRKLRVEKSRPKPPKEDSPNPRT